MIHWWLMADFTDTNTSAEWNPSLTFIFLNKFLYTNFHQIKWNNEKTGLIEIIYTKSTWSQYFKRGSQIYEIKSQTFDFVAEFLTFFPLQFGLII